MHPFNENDWPKDSAVKIVKGNGQKKLAVFMDPMCSFCQKLSRETLSNMNDITVYVYIWPFLSEESVELAGSILSSQDPQRALIDWMKFGKVPSGFPTAASDEIIKKNIRLAESLGLHGTPAMYLSDGRGPFSAMSATALAHKLTTEIE